MKSFASSHSEESGPNALREVLRRLQGLHLTAAVWEGLVLPSRLPGYKKEWLDELCASGELIWSAKAPEMQAGNETPEIGFYFEEDCDSLMHLFCPRWDGELDEEESRVIDYLHDKGAVFATAIARSIDMTSSDCLKVLRRLVLKGFVSNDTFSPIRLWDAAKRSVKVSAKAIPVGRWFLLSYNTGVKETVRPLIDQVLSRYGLLCRDIGELVPEDWKFRQIEDGLVRMEDAGQIRRGYIIEELSGMQFASTHAFEKMQNMAKSGGGLNLQTTSGTRLISLQDPSSVLYKLWLTKKGFTLGKLANSHLILLDGSPAVFAEGNGARLTSLSELSRDEIEICARCVASIGKQNQAMGGKARVEVKSWNSKFLVDDEMADIFSKAGFTKGVRSLMSW
jgi:ATP-dependent Lhr-like helicase